MPIEGPRQSQTQLYVEENSSDFLSKCGEMIRNIPYNMYSSRRFDGNSDGEGRDFDRLFGEFCARLGRVPVNRMIAGAGILGGRQARVELSEHKKGYIVERSIVITFDGEPETVYFFGDGAHVYLIDPVQRRVLDHEEFRGPAAQHLMDDLKEYGRPRS